MSFQVCAGATMRCSFGSASSTLAVLPEKNVLAKAPAACLSDSKPVVNILPFGMCSAPTNPTVAAATAAGMGALTPMPRTPATPAPWIPPRKPAVVIRGAPPPPSDRQLLCNWGGVIKVVRAGQVSVRHG